MTPLPPPQGVSFSPNLGTRQLRSSQSPEISSKPAARSSPNGTLPLARFPPHSLSEPALQLRSELEGENYS